MIFNNTYDTLPDIFFTESTPKKFSDPQLLAFNEELAAELGIDLSHDSNEELAAIFSGQKILDGAHLISSVYAAHQFGHFVPRLGDGRATLMGEVVSPQGKRYDIQLKGSGPTEYSRRGDGLSALGPVIREYIVSEAMHHLGVPTTRALAAVVTGDPVYRQQVEPGGVFTRVASSHIRIGTFQYFASTRNLDDLKTLLDYTIDRHYPEIKDDKSGINPAILFLRQVKQKQIQLVSKWMSYGFIHGVMNTDNTAISGETIDFGPCAFIDNFQADKVFSSIDHQGRYAYNNQQSIVAWNLCRLADCLVPFIDEDAEKAVEQLNEELSTLPDDLENQWLLEMAPKFGLSPKNLPSQTKKLILLYLDYLEDEELDFTLSFRNLAELAKQEKAIEFFPQKEKLQEFLKLWLPLIEDVDSTELANSMRKVNPLYIPRNHQVEKAIHQAYQGNLQLFHELNKALQKPFTYQAEFDRFAVPPLPEEEVKATFCGT